MISLLLYTLVPFAFAQIEFADLVDCSGWMLSTGNDLSSYKGLDDCNALPEYSITNGLGQTKRYQYNTCFLDVDYDGNDASYSDYSTKFCLLNACGESSVISQGSGILFYLTNNDFQNCGLGGGQCATYANLTCDCVSNRNPYWNDPDPNKRTNDGLPYVCDWEEQIVNDEGNKVWVARNISDGNVTWSYDQTSAPTKAPTDSPTELPTRSPTPQPTESPTSMPSTSPTSSPSTSPTTQPSPSPTTAPTSFPSTSPTSSPTDSPTEDNVHFEFYVKGLSDAAKTYLSNNIVGFTDDNQRAIWESAVNQALTSKFDSVNLNPPDWFDGVGAKIRVSTTGTKTLPDGSEVFSVDMWGPFYSYAGQEDFMRKVLNTPKTEFQAHGDVAWMIANNLRLQENFKDLELEGNGVFRPGLDDDPITCLSETDRQRVYFDADFEAPVKKYSAEECKSYCQEEGCYYAHWKVEAQEDIPFSWTVQEWLPTTRRRERRSLDTVWSTNTPGGNASCVGYTCGANQFVRVGNECASPVCVDSDAASCCGDQQSCTSFGTCSHNTTDIDVNAFCATDACAASDEGVCCIPFSWQDKTYTVMNSTDYGNCYISHEIRVDFEYVASPDTYTRKNYICNPKTLSPTVSPSQSPIQDPCDVLTIRDVDPQWDGEYARRAGEADRMFNESTWHHMDKYIYWHPSGDGTSSGDGTGYWFLVDEADNNALKTFGYGASLHPPLTAHWVVPEHYVFEGHDPGTDYVITMECQRTFSPSVTPSSSIPSMTPSRTPSTVPTSSQPSVVPTGMPSKTPSIIPSGSPSQKPSGYICSELLLYGAPMDWTGVLQQEADDNLHHERWQWEDVFGLKMFWYEGTFGEKWTLADDDGNFALCDESSYHTFPPEDALWEIVDNSAPIHTYNEHDPMQTKCVVAAIHFVMNEPFEGDAPSTDERRWIYEVFTSEPELVFYGLDMFVIAESSQQKFNWVFDDKETEMNDKFSKWHRDFTYSGAPLAKVPMTFEDGAGNTYGLLGEASDLTAAVEGALNLQVQELGGRRRLSSDTKKVRAYLVDSDPVIVAVEYKETQDLTFSANFTAEVQKRLVASGYYGSNSGISFQDPSADVQLAAVITAPPTEAPTAAEVEETTEAALETEDDEEDIWENSDYWPYAATGALLLVFIIYAYCQCRSRAEMEKKMVALQEEVDEVEDQQRIQVLSNTPEPKKQQHHHKKKQEHEHDHDQPVRKKTHEDNQAQQGIRVTKTKKKKKKRINSDGGLMAFTPGQVNHHGEGGVELTQMEGQSAEKTQRLDSLHLAETTSANDIESNTLPPSIANRRQTDPFKTPPVHSVPPQQASGLPKRSGLPQRAAADPTKSPVVNHDDPLAQQGWNLDVNNVRDLRVVSAPPPQPLQGKRGPDTPPANIGGGMTEYKGNSFVQVKTTWTQDPSGMTQEEYDRRNNSLSFLSHIIPETASYEQMSDAFEVVEDFHDFDFRELMNMIQQIDPEGHGYITQHQFNAWLSVKDFDNADVLNVRNAVLDHPQVFAEKLSTVLTNSGGDNVYETDEDAEFYT